MLQICDWLTGKDPTVRNFLFSAVHYQGAVNHSDQVLLAVDGAVVIGGMILRTREVFSLNADEQVRSLLLKEARRKRES